MEQLLDSAVTKTTFLGDSHLSLLTLLGNLVIGTVLALILRWHFSRFGSTLSNKEEFGLIFPFILLTTLLIITVVKSSLALSLGLVGALSIVRFRTPIKEPEELAYLFLAIAMGLGLGANQPLPTIVAALTILGIMTGVKFRQHSVQQKNLYLSLDWAGDPTESPPQLDQLNQIVADHTLISDLRRYDLRAGALETSYFIDIKSPGHLAQLADELKTRFPNIGVTFIDQTHLPSV